MDLPPKRFVKALFGQALVRTGHWNRALRTWAQRHTTIILVYHRVLETWDGTLDFSEPGMVVTVPTFERQVSFIREHFDVAPFASVLADENTDRPPTRPRCVITFDDGWRDNYDLAFPILHRHGLPATIFLTTDFIGTNRAFWHTELIYLFTCTELWRVLRDAVTLRAYPDPVHHHLKRLGRRGESPRTHDLHRLIETVKAVCDEEVIEKLLNTLMQAVDLHRPLIPERTFFLDWDQVRAMAAGGIEIGSHGCSHRILTMVPIEAAKEEFVRSKAEIERRIGWRVEHFAFPNGAASDALLRAAATGGYRTACLDGSVAHGEPLGIRPLRRLGMHEQVSSDGRSFDEARLHYWLFRAPCEVPA